MSTIWGAGQDLLIVAKELAFIYKNRNSHYSQRAKLEFLIRNPNILKVIANALNEGYSLELSGLESKFDSGNFDFQKFAQLEQILMDRDEQTEKVSDALSLNAIESQEFADNIADLLKQLINRDFDMRSKEDIIIFLYGKDNVGRYMNYIFKDFSDVLIRNVGRADLDLRDNRNSIYEINDGNYDVVSRNSIFKKMVCRSLLLKNEKEFDTELLNFLVEAHFTDIPVSSYLDPETISQLPPEERVLFSLLIKINPKEDSLGMANFIIENKENVIKLVDAQHHITTDFLIFFFNSRYALADRPFDGVEPFIKEAGIVPGFIDYLNLIYPLEFKKSLHYLDILQIFIENDDNQSREIKLIDYWLNKSPAILIQTFSKESLKLVFGESVGNDFLSALPQETNERRNAFLHNKYDRTSEWLQFMIKQTNGYDFEYQCEGISFNFIEDIGIATEFISRFGLAKNARLFAIYKILYLAENDKEFQIPEEISDFGIKTKEDVFVQYNAVRQHLTSIEPLTDLTKLTKFQILLLSNATGKDTHKFPRSESMEELISKYNQEVSSNLISSVAPEYSTVDITLQDIEITYEPSELATNTFEKIKALTNEVLSKLDSKDYWQTIKSEFIQSLVAKKDLLLTVINNPEEPDQKKQHFRKQFEMVATELEKVEKSVNSLEEMFAYLVEYSPGNRDKDEWSQLIQKIVFFRMLEIGSGQNKLQEIATLSELDQDSVLTMVNIYNEVIKHHVVNFGSDHSSPYWSQKLRDSFTNPSLVKQIGNVNNIFANYGSLFRKEIDGFEQKNKDSAVDLCAIPDKGFIGEMSGYIANACYTNESSLLANWPVTPYKFIDKSTNPPELVGTALVFELELDNGEKVMLIRAVNIPNENRYNIDAFCEKFIDSIFEVATRNGSTKVLVPGSVGAMSNYQRTINHIKYKYCEGKTPVNLSKEFSFNDYNLTNNCFVAREV